MLPIAALLLLAMAYSGKKPKPKPKPKPKKRRRKTRRKKADDGAAAAATAAVNVRRRSVRGAAGRLLLALASEPGIRRSSDPRVAAAQRALGAPLKADGILGPRTLAAARRAARS